MADFAPPSGPPPPKVPEGWKAVWNAQYSEWFYVNTYTKKSQWDLPTTPVYPQGGGGDAPPGGAPPGYDQGSAKLVGPEKGGYDPSEDEKLARKLQEEENARANVGGSGPPAGNRGESDAYYGGGGPGAGPPGYGQSPQPQYGQQQGGGYPPQPGYPQQYGAPSPQPQGMYGDPNGPGAQGVQGQEKKGLLGKLFGGKKPQQQQQQGYGNPYAQPGKKPGGIGAGGLALGAGGGLLGGALLASAMDGHHGGGGYGGGGYGGGYGGDDGGYGGGDDGGNYGGDDGGRFGGDDGGGDGGGGGDFGGDFGGDGGGDGGGGD